MGLTKEQIIDDVLDRYEAHLAFLTFSSESATASVLTPRMPSSDQVSSVTGGAQQSD